MEDFKKLSVTIVTHVYATGPSFKLEEYLQRKVRRLVFIGHPFSFANDTRSFIRVYEKGKLVREERFIRWRGSELFFYIKDFLLTCFWNIKYAGKTDYFIGVNGFNVFAGLMLQPFLKIRRIIFYTIDYVPHRFENSLMNLIYHKLDKLALHKSYRVWNLSSIMAEQREKNDLDKGFRDKQIVVPVGTDVRIEKKDLKKFDKNKIIFLGHLRKGQGLEILIEAMEGVVSKVKNANLLIIGGGPLENVLKVKIKKFRLGKNIDMHGFVENYNEVKELMSNAAIAVAPYEDNEKTYTRFTDPGKPKDYLAAGLPVVITKVPQVAFEIQRRNCGIAVNYSRKEISDAIVKLLLDKNLLKLKENALEFANDYRWEKIFNKAFEETL